AWWDASQIYGFDELSVKRVKRDPDDPAKLSMPNNYLPLLSPCRNPDAPDCVTQIQWNGQESVAFPANWSIGLSFYHNLFAREHNYFVDYFRKQQALTPGMDSGLRNPEFPQKVITYQDVSDEELFQIARLVVSAEIAKIHTIEWTTQLLYNEPLYQGMNSNWYGLFNLEESRVSATLRGIANQDKNVFGRFAARLANWFGESDDAEKNSALYSIAASGAGIFGLGNKRMEGLPFFKTDRWSLENNDDINGGVNHFGSPFNFPEEFPSVYRLHPLLPDLIEYREWEEPNAIVSKVPIINTVRGNATDEMHSRGLENWALSMGRQRLGLLHLRNHPHFLQDLPVQHLGSGSGQLDVPALDIIRDRERGIPRFNEMRRQIGLRNLSSFDDFVDQRLPADSEWRKHQEETVKRMREVYGTHICDETKIISVVQKEPDGSPITDCHGFPNGTEVDNIEDVDNVVGWLAEYTRPHGFAISETQFHLFIINASRRLFSDRFFTSSFRPEFYSDIGYDWLIHNGPLQECPYPLEELADDSYACNEPVESNGHKIQVSPLKRVLMRNAPELRDELLLVVNAFDPWARDRGEYYSLDWVPRGDAVSDPAFDVQ
ncbi:MAG: peroxidase family protein, partial [Anaerolineales bacterium]|nr:peroxidase family protein [Anaerolineales bacterium]